MFLLFFFQSFTTPWSETFAWTCNPRRQQALPFYAQQHTWKYPMAVQPPLPPMAKAHIMMLPAFLKWAEELPIVEGLEVPQETQVPRSRNSHHSSLHLFVLFILDIGKLSSLSHHWRMSNVLLMLLLTHRGASHPMVSTLAGDLVEQELEHLNATWHAGIRESVYIHWRLYIRQEYHGGGRGDDDSLTD